MVSDTLATPQTATATTPTTTATTSTPVPTASTPGLALTVRRTAVALAAGDGTHLDGDTSRRESSTASTASSAAPAGAVTGWLTAPSAVAAPADTAYGRAQRTHRTFAPTPQDTARRYISAGVVLYDTTCWLYAAGTSATASAHALVPRPNAGAIARQHTAPTPAHTRTNHTREARTIPSSPTTCCHAHTNGTAGQAPSTWTFISSRNGTSPCARRSVSSTACELSLRSTP
ncbi:hypothetical protein ASG96_07020 [Terrabacter sp. Soil810]|nr:hypothetical protein ASG96_07020 [Terrabacter sp. Soil810]